jgi:Holliday junction resolvasome RuvABC endonuclease subunit
MNTVLGVDLGTNTGHCLIVGFDGDAKVTTSTLKNPDKVQSVLTLDCLARWFSDVIKNSRPDIVVVEGYAYNKSQGATFSGERCGIIKLLAHRNKVRILFIAPQRLKKYAMGNKNLKETGSDGKQEIRIQAAIEYGQGSARNDHEADAMYLARLGYQLITDTVSGIPHRDSVIHDIKEEQRKEDEKLQAELEIQDGKDRKREAAQESKRVREAIKASKPPRKPRASKKVTQ